MASWLLHGLATIELAGSKNLRMLLLAGDFLSCIGCWMDFQLAAEEKRSAAWHYAFANYSTLKNLKIFWCDWVKVTFYWTLSKSTFRYLTCKIAKLYSKSIFLLFIRVHIWTSYYNLAALPSSFHASLLSCVSHFLHLSSPVYLLFCFLLSCIPPFQHPYFSASLISCIYCLLHPSFPAFLLACLLL